MDLLIIGHGSIGKRHYKNAVEIGIEKNKIGIVDPAGESTLELDDALKLSPKGVMICTPYQTHFDIAKQVFTQTKSAVFIEKPLCHSLEEADELLELAGDRPVVMGYCWRFHEGIRELVSAIMNKSNEYRQIVRASIRCHSCVSMWPGHPSTYGDVVYEMSHEIDLARHLFGSDKIEKSVVNPSEAWLCLTSTPEPSTGVASFQNQEFNVDLDLKYVSYTNHELRDIKVFWDDGGVTFRNWKSKPKHIHDMYITELRDFIGLTWGLNGQSVSAQLTDGREAIRIINDAE
jgi:predicted dehydrogenase